MNYDLFGGPDPIQGKPDPGTFDLLGGPDPVQGKPDPGTFDTMGGPDPGTFDLLRPSLDVPPPADVHPDPEPDHIQPLLEQDGPQDPE